MCGRYTYLFTWKQLRRLMMLTAAPGESLTARYNVAPTQAAPVVRAAGGGRSGKGDGGKGRSEKTPDGEGGGREGVLLRWGLVPSWADDPAIGNRLVNARSETAASKPAFRQVFKRRRCLVPVSGFYEWAKVGPVSNRPGGRGRKQPFYFHPADGEVFAFAGLWERWRAKEEDGEPVETFTILTTDANEAVRPVHGRMPVILPPEAWDLWLDPGVDDPDRLTALLKPCDPALIASHPVSTAVNRPAHDKPDCIEPAGDEGGGPGELF